MERGSLDVAARDASHVSFGARNSGSTIMANCILEDGRSASPGGLSQLVLCLSLRQAIYSTFQKISYFWVMRSMVKPENPRVPTH